MATETQIADLRRLVDEPTQDPYTDVVLGARIDAEPNITTLASTIWREKAARYAGLIDIKEGNSDRKMSQLYTQALAMSKSFVATTEDGSPVTTRRPARTRQIERM